MKSSSTKKPTSKVKYAILDVAEHQLLGQVRDTLPEIRSELEGLWSDDSLGDTSMEDIEICELKRIESPNFKMVFTRV